MNTERNTKSENFKEIENSNPDRETFISSIQDYILLEANSGIPLTIGGTTFHTGANPELIEQVALSLINDDKITISNSFRLLSNQTLFEFMQKDISVLKQANIILKDELRKPKLTQEETQILENYEELYNILSNLKNIQVQNQSDQGNTIDQFITAINEIDLSINELSNENKNSKEEVKCLNQKISQLETQLKQTKEDLELELKKPKINDKQKEILSTYPTIFNNYSTVIKKFEELNTSLSIKDQEIDDLKQKNNNLSSKIEHINNNLELELKKPKLTQEETQILENYEELYNIANNLKKMQNLAITDKELNQIIDQFALVISNLEDKIATQTDTINTLKNDLNSQNNLTEQFNNIDKQFQNLQSSITQSKQTASNSEQLIKDLKESLLIIEELSSNLEYQLDNDNEKLSIMNNEIDKLEIQISDLEEENQQLIKEKDFLDKKAATLEELSKDNSVSELELNRLKDQLYSYQTSNEEKTKEIEKLKSSLAIQQLKYKEIENSNISLNNNLADLKDSSNQSVDNLNLTAQKELEQLKMDNEKLKEDNKFLLSSLSNDKSGQNPLLSSESPSRNETLEEDSTAAKSSTTKEESFVKKTIISKINYSFTKIAVAGAIFVVVAGVLMSQTNLISKTISFAKEITSTQTKPSNNISASLEEEILSPDIENSSTPPSNAQESEIIEPKKVQNDPFAQDLDSSQPITEDDNTLILPEKDNSSFQTQQKPKKITQSELKEKIRSVKIDGKSFIYDGKSYSKGDLFFEYKVLYVAQENLACYFYDYDTDETIIAKQK